MPEYNQGFFKPKFPKKYAGDPKKIVYRSSWEWHIMDELDRNSNILEWSSEEFFIRYRDPVTGNSKRYFPDFLVKKKEKNGNVVKQLLEIKPFEQCFKPKGSRKVKTHNEALKTYARNIAKWAAAKEFAKKKGWEFIIVTKHPIRGDWLLLTEKEIKF
jgi:hypothetical protein